MSGIILNVTRKIYTQIGNDEIQFNINVKNITAKEQCYMIHLYDEAGKYIGKTPRNLWLTQMGHKILPGATETKILGSDEMFWHIGDIEGQVVEFRLFANPSFLTVCSSFESSYDQVDSKHMSISSHTEEDIEDAVDAVEKLFIVIAIIAGAYLLSQVSKFR